MKKIIFYLFVIPIFLLADFKQKLTLEEKNWLENKEIIIVGAMDNWAPINFINHNKEPLGIGFSLVELLNKKLDNKLKIESSSWNNIYEKAKNSKIDLILDITPKKEREEFFFFSKPYLQIPHVIVSKSEQKPFKSLEDLKGKTVALEEGVGTISDLKNNYPQIDIKTFENTTLALDAVSRGLADAYIGNRAVVTYKLSTELLNNLKIDSVDTTRVPSLLTIGVPKNYPILYSIIQKAMDELTPQEFNQIYKKWSSEDWIELKLTNQEKEWLQNNPIIKFAADPNYMPYESFDSNGNYVGFISTYLTSIEETLGIKFDIIKTDSWQETLEYAKDNKIDMFTNYMEAKEFESTHITKALDIKSPIVVVGKKDKNEEFIISVEQLKDKKIVVIKDYFYLNEIYKQFPNFNYIEVDNASIALDGVSSGLYDVALCSLPVAIYNISQFGLSNLEIVGKTDTFMQLGFSIRKDYEIFSRIIEKVLVQYKNEDFNKIIKDWQKVTKDSTLDWNFILKILFLIILTIIFLLLWNYQLKRKVAKKTYELSKLLKFFDENVIASKTDLQGNITYVSEAFCNISGYKKEFLLGKNHRINKHKDNPKYIFEQMWSEITQGKLWRGRIKNRRKDGSYYWVDSLIEQEKDFNGKVIGYVSIRHDVTAQVELEDLSKNLENIVKERTNELYELHRKQKAIFDTVNIGILLLKDRKILELNNQICLSFGYEYDELLNQCTKIFYKNEDDFNYVSKEYELLKSGEIATWEQLFVRKNLSTFWARVSMQAIDFKDSSKGIVAIINDITLEKKAIEDIKKAKLLAEESTKSKSEFLANMSHEIRTPMNAIIGMSYLVLQTSLNEQQKNYIQKIDMASKNLLGIINDILDFSKIEAGKMNFERIDFSLNDVLSNISNLFMFQIEEKGLELLFDIDINVPISLKGDLFRINQVLTNFLSNAIKFTSKGEIILSINLIEKNKNSAKIRFEVKDTGIGLSKEQKLKLFNSFSQADSSTTRKYGGSGLGLAICKQIVELMHGEIGVKSELGVGSNFYFELELQLQDEQQKIMEINKEIKDLKILIVDDNASSREILENIIKSLEFEVKSLCCGKESIIELKEAYLKGKPYDLVLMDWMMPQMDGLDTIAKINQDKQIEKIPTFIMVTAYNKDELIQKAKDTNIVGFLEKPISPSSLYDSILKAFGNNIIINAHENMKIDNFKEIKNSLTGNKALLVEDNLQNQEIAIAFLDNLGIKTVVSNNGKEALEALERDDFNVILMDCQMPIMDGYEASKQIRKIDKFKDLPIIAMTANAMQGDKQKCIDAGMNDYMSKPLDFNRFYETLISYVKSNNIEEINKNKDVLKSVLDFEIEGLDLELALNRMALNTELLKNQLNRFVKSQKNFQQKIDVLVNSNQLEELIREIHTLKSLCGNIAATKLFDEANNLEEYLIYNGIDDNVLKLIKELSLNLKNLVSNIAKQMNISIITDEDFLVSNLLKNDEKIKKLFQELEILLKELDSSAIDKINQIKTLLGKNSLEEIEILENYINSFDFDKAIEFLRNIK